MARVIRGLLKEFGLAELNGQIATVTLSLAAGLFALTHGALVVTIGEQITYHGTIGWRKRRQEGWGYI